MTRPGNSKVNIKMILLNKEEFQLLSKEGEEDGEWMVRKITNVIQKNALDTAGGHREQKNE